MKRTRQALGRLLERARDAARREIPAGAIIDQLPPSTIPPATGDARGGVVLSDAAPEDVTSGSAAAGTSSEAARGDHVHHTAASGVSDGDKGDITVSSSGTVWTIDDGVVTVAKLSFDPATQAELDAEATTRAAADTALAAPQYLTLALSATLANERRLVAGSGISITDGGANGDATIAATAMTLDDLSDVVITSPAAADRLRYDGSVWRNSALIWRPLMTYDPSTGNYLVVTTIDGDAVLVEA